MAHVIIWYSEALQQKEMGDTVLWDFKTQREVISLWDHRCMHWHCLPKQACLIKVKVVHIHYLYEMMWVLVPATQVADADASVLCMLICSLRYCLNKLSVCLSLLALTFTCSSPHQPHGQQPFLFLIFQSYLQCLFHHFEQTVWWYTQENFALDVTVDLVLPLILYSLSWWSELSIRLHHSGIQLQHCPFWCLTYSTLLLSVTEASLHPTYGHYNTCITLSGHN